MVAPRTIRSAFCAAACPAAPPGVRGPAGLCDRAPVGPPVGPGNAGMALLGEFGAEDAEHPAHTTRGFARHVQSVLQRHVDAHKKNVLLEQHRHGPVRDKENQAVSAASVHGDLERRLQASEQLLKTELKSREEMEYLLLALRDLAMNIKPRKPKAEKGSKSEKGGSGSKSEKEGSGSKSGTKEGRQVTSNVPLERYIRTLHSNVTRGQLVFRLPRAANCPSTRVPSSRPALPPASLFTLGSPAPSRADRAHCSNLLPTHP